MPRKDQHETKAVGSGREEAESEKTKSSKCMGDMNAQGNGEVAICLRKSRKTTLLKEMSVMARQEKASFFPSKKCSWCWARMGTKLLEEIKWERFSQKGTSQNQKEQTKLLTKYMN